MNPARTFGPNVISNEVTSIPTFLISTIFGVLHAAGLYNYLKNRWKISFLKRELIDNYVDCGMAMSEKRLLRKMKKLASRIHQQMESVRDVMDDLEIEFELLQSQIAKLEVKRGKSSSNDEEIEVVLDEEEDEQIDLENTSTVTIKQKF